MSGPIVPMQIAPLANVEKVAQVAHNYAGEQQLMLRETAAEAVRLQEQKIGGHEKSRQNRGVKARKDGNSGPSYQEPQQRKAKSDADQAEMPDLEAQPESADSGNVWAGNILNLKV